MNDIKEKKAVGVRDSNLELYRILCMLMIVSHHYVVNSGLTALDGPMMHDPLSLKNLYLWSFGMWGKTGINCFLMITGYFMCKSSITFRKFLKLLLQIYFYRLSIFAVFFMFDYEAVSLTRVVKLLMPVWNFQSNFVSCFIAFWLLIPFLNILIRHLSKRQHELLLLLLLTCYTLLGSLPKFHISFNYISWFSIIYFISSYIRLYPIRLFTRTNIWALATLSSIGLAILSMCFMISAFGASYAYFFVAESNRIFAVTTAVSSFLWFKNMHIPNSSIINTIGASTFAVLLIHANSDAMRHWLWNDVVGCVANYEFPLLYLMGYSVLAVLMIFSVCVLIDQIRIMWIEKRFFIWYDKRFKKDVSTLK